MLILSPWSHVVVVVLLLLTLEDPDCYDTAGHENNMFQIETDTSENTPQKTLKITPNKPVCANLSFSRKGSN